jgi:RNA polymerase sigma factor (TIGR02999 family)
VYIGLHQEKAQSAGKTDHRRHSYNLSITMDRQEQPVSEVTTLLQAWSEGDQAALARLTTIVYRELHRQARRYMRGERPGHSLQPTALVNEAYMRLTDYKRIRWQNRAHFLAISAQVMRRILVEHARRRNLKRGGGVQHIALEKAALYSGDGATDLVALNDALTALARVNARKAQVVEMRFFGGLSMGETAEVLGVSEVTVRRDWSTAQAWLCRELTGNAGHGPRTVEARR